MSIIDQKEYLNLFDEFEENKTKEARFVKSLDKLEMAIQAYEYEREYKVDLAEFFEDAESIITGKDLKELLKQIKNLRIK